jgi:dolichol-phosphate mannosyltransferase
LALSSSKHTTVVIPTFNEHENIRRLVPAVLAQDAGLSVLVVDDNSPDGTAAAVEQLAAADSRVALLPRPRRAGIGPAYVAGFTQALRNGADYIVQMDADFSHPVEALSRFLSEMPEYDVVSGSRYLTGITVVNWPMHRLLISYFGNQYARRVTGLPVSDVTSGFKCWRRQALERIALEQVRSNGYAFQIEMAYRAWCSGQRIKEVPIIFMDRTSGDSKMDKSMIVEALRIVWWLRIMRLLGRL